MPIGRHSLHSIDTVTNVCVATKRQYRSPAPVAGETSSRAIPELVTVCDLSNAEKQKMKQKEEPNPQDK